MEHVYLRDVTTLKLTSDKCTGCGMCINVCPQGVLALSEGRVKISHKDKCMECGACAKNCRFQALEVQAGVGCAYAIILGKLTGTEPSCDCSGSSGCC